MHHTFKKGNNLNRNHPFYSRHNSKITEFTLRNEENAILFTFNVNEIYIEKF